MTKRLLPPLKSLIALEAVVRHGSVTTAAAELCVTHGAISKHLASLEDWLGLQLFLDNRRRMVPTDAALTLAEGTGAGLAAIERHWRRSARPDGRRRKASDAVFQIIAPATFAMHWLIPRLPDLKRSGSALKARVRPTHTPENWRELTWDLAIRSGDRAFPADLTAIPLFRDALGCWPRRGCMKATATCAKSSFWRARPVPGSSMIGWPLPGLAARRSRRLRHSSTTILRLKPPCREKGPWSHRSPLLRARSSVGP